MKRGIIWVALGVVFLMVLGLFVFWPTVDPEPDPADPVVEDPVVEDPVQEEPVGEMVFNEAPMLAEKVAAGALPPVAERLPIPEDIVILEPVEEIGTYGGTLRKVAADPGQGWLKMLLYEPGTRWNRDLTGYETGVFRGHEFNEDGTSITFFLRRGLRWSDGQPFTTDDLRFWWEDLAGDPDFGEVPVPGWMYLKGERATVDFIDEYTMRINFAYPNWILPYTMAQGFWVWEPLMAPRHYLEQYHPKYNPAMEGDYTLLGERRMWWMNPDHPVLFAWRPVEIDEEKMILERNPFYWKVDTAGNQLPYIDRIVSTIAIDPGVRLMKLLAGDIDVSFREASGDPKDIPAILEVAEEVGIRHMTGWVAGEGAWRSLFINQDYVPDEYVRELLRNKYFRRGLSHAMNREHIHEIIGLGMGRITTCTIISPQGIHFLSPEGKAIYEELRVAHIEYNVELANEMLDKAGLDARDPATGFRLRADTGEVFEMFIQAGLPVSADGAKLLGLVEPAFEAVGIKTTLAEITGPEAWHNFEEGLYHVHLWDGPGAELDLFTFPDNLFVTGLYVRAFPMQKQWLETGGVEGWEPVGPGKALNELYVAALAEPDMEKRHQYVWDAVRVHIDEGPFVLATFQGMPMPVFVKENLRNVPNFGILAPWAPGSPGAQDPPQWFFRN